MQIKKIEVYIANDGTEFKTKEECVNYECKAIDSAINYYSDKELQDIQPIDFDNMVGDPGIHNFFWFRINSERSLKDILGAFNLNAQIPRISIPDIICIETVDDYHRERDGYLYSMNEIISETEKFYEKFGYNIEVVKH
ncbi:MAG TPA: hypothetical protein DCW90_03580 [Lachnospiraceae bacterium]|nr:hypothetical protein [Lachnospiraceae bacterium]